MKGTPCLWGNTPTKIKRIVKTKQIKYKLTKTKQKL